MPGDQKSSAQKGSGNHTFLVCGKCQLGLGMAHGLLQGATIVEAAS